VPESRNRHSRGAACGWLDLPTRLRSNPCKEPANRATTSSPRSMTAPGCACCGSTTATPEHRNPVPRLRLPETPVPRRHDPNRQRAARGCARTARPVRRRGHGHVRPRRVAGARPALRAPRRRILLPPALRSSRSPSVLAADAPDVCLVRQQTVLRRAFRASCSAITGVNWEKPSGSAVGARGTDSAGASSTSQAIDQVVASLGRATGLVSVPMPSIVIETTSPGSSVNGASGTSPAPVSR
jgi:hypothetical protein